MSFDVTRYANNGAELRIRFFREFEGPIRQAADAVVATLRSGGKVLAFGNGGSAADAQHLAGEFVGRFRGDRLPLAAIALSSDPSVLTCIGNDYDYTDVFARQLQALGQPDDVAWAISTSGRSPNVLKGIEVAKQRGMRVVGLTGRDGGMMAPLCDIPLIVPSNETALIQEVHLAILHVVCEIVEENFVG